MNITDKTLETLFVGDRIVDEKLRRAFCLGIRHGQASDRDNIAKSTRIDTVTKLIIALMRTQGIGLEQAMRALELPKADRDICRRIIVQRPKKPTQPY